MLQRKNILAPNHGSTKRKRRLKPNPPTLLLLQPFIVAMCHQRFEGEAVVAVQDGIDGVMTGNILNLAATEIVTLSQNLDVGLW